MNSVRIDNETKKATYPCLMEYTNGEPFIVLFTGFEEGVIVQSNNSNRPIGQYHTEWNMGVFESYDGTVSLSNE